LSLAEMEYALFMGYDSVVLEPDLEIGGADQYLNMHMCRTMMNNANQKPEIIITYNLLAGTTGEKDEQGRYIKMSKSRGNYIPVTAEPADMYGKVMSIPDDVMWIWYRELTEITADDLKSLKVQTDEGQIHPKEAKQLLARVIVGTFNNFDLQVVTSAEGDFNEKFGKKAVLIPESAKVIDWETIVSGGTTTYVTNPTPSSTINTQETCITSLANISGRSKSDIRRLVQQKGIRILEEGKQDYELMKFEELTELSSLFADKNVRVIKIGKRDYYKLKK